MKTGKPVFILFCLNLHGSFVFLGYAGWGGGRTFVPEILLHPAMPKARGRLCGDRFSASGLCV